MTATVKLTHPGSSLAIETTPDLARPYLDQGWSEKNARKSRNTAVRASAKSGPAAPTKKENNDGD